MLVNQTFSMGALPADFNGTPQEFANAVAAGLISELNLDALVVTGQVGGTEPVSNVGLWFPPVTGSTTDPSGIIYAWNSTSAKYLPAPLVAGQLVGANVYLTQLQSTATADRVQKLADKDGTVALLSDISTGTGIKTYTGGAVTINWEDRKSAYITLTSNCTITLAGEPTDDQWLDLWIENNSGNTYTVTHPADILWPGGTAPTQTISGGASERRIDHIRYYNIGATSPVVYGEAVEQDYQASSGSDTDKPTFDVVTRYGNTITITMSEAIRGGSLTTSGFKVRTPMGGTLQTVSAVTATGSEIRVVMAASMPSTSDYTFEYSGSDVKDLTGNVADPLAEAVVPYVNVAGTIGGSGGVGGGHNEP